jgi:hypothetical protein
LNRIKVGLEEILVLLSQVHRSMSSRETVRSSAGSHCRMQMQTHLLKRGWSMPL